LALGQLVVESGELPEQTAKPVVEPEKQKQTFVRQPESENSGGWIRRRTN
jgi:hypothetical protein